MFLSISNFLMCFILFSFSPFRCTQVNENDVYLSYLPLAHIFDRVIEEFFIFSGASIGFWRGVWHSYENLYFLHILTPLFN